MSKLINVQGLLKQSPEVQGGYADDNETHSFKGRTIDTTKLIKVYRNLHKKGVWYSIKQNGLVVAHSTALCIRAPEFTINTYGKQKAIETGIRNVHAFIIGYYETNGMGTTAKKNDLPVKVKYNPFKSFGFYYESCGENKEVKKARFGIANNEGVKVAYIIE